MKWFSVLEFEIIKLVLQIEIFLNFFYVGKNKIADVL